MLSEFTHYKESELTGNMIYYKQTPDVLQVWVEDCGWVDSGNQQVDDLLPR